MRCCLISLLFLFLSGCEGTSTQKAVTGHGYETNNADTATPLKDRPVNNEPGDRYMSVIDPIAELPREISKFIPSGYLPLDTAIGDLNLDGTNDLLLVVKNKAEDTITPSNDSPQIERPLLILLGDPDGTYHLARQNHRAVMAVNSSGIVSSDPFTGLAIKNGYFSIEHGVAEGPQHWQQITTFKYDRNKKEWFLFKIGSVSQVRNDDTNMEAEAMKEYSEFKTQKDFGIVTFEQYDLNKE